MDKHTFPELGIAPELLDAVKSLGFEQPSPIQAEAIPVALTGRDVVGQSQTGSGKTVAFGLAMAATLLSNACPKQPRNRPPPRCVACPGKPGSRRPARLSSARPPWSPQPPKTRPRRPIKHRARPPDPSGPACDATAPTSYPDHRMPTPALQFAVRAALASIPPMRADTPAEAASHDQIPHCRPAFTFPRPPVGIGMSIPVSSHERKPSMITVTAILNAIEARAAGVAIALASTALQGCPARIIPGAAAACGGGVGALAQASRTQDASTRRTIEGVEEVMARAAPSEGLRGL